MEKSMLDAVHDGTQDLHHCAYALSDIAYALRRVGMADLATEIGQISRDISTIAKEINAAYGRDLSRQVRTAHEATGNMLSGILAMSSMKEDAASQ